MDSRKFSLRRSPRVISWVVISFWLGPISAICAPFTDDEAPRLPVIDENTTLSDYLTFAALENAGLKAAYLRWQAALQKEDQVTALPNPKLSYVNYIKEVETRVGPQRQKVGASQMFPWFGKLRLRGEVAREKAGVFQQQYQAVKLALFFQVKDAYHELYYLSRAIDITQENIVLLKDMEAVAQANYKAGATISAVIKAQVELVKLEDELQTLQDKRGPWIAKLNEALNRPYDAQIYWPKFMAYGQVNIRETQLLEWMRAQNPKLKSLQSQISKEEKAVSLAKKDFFPDFSLGVDWVDTDKALNANAFESGKDALMARVSVSVPLQRKKYKAAVREARFLQASFIEAKHQLENDLETRVKKVLFRFQDADRKISLYKQTLIPLAKESLEVTQQAYINGRDDFLSLIDAQRLLLKLQLLQERQQSFYWQTLAELEMLVGRVIDTPTSP